MTTIYTVELNGTEYDIEGPDNATEEQLKTAALQGESQAEKPKEYSRGFFKTYEGQPRGLLQKADVLAGKTALKGMDVLSAPYELAGEAIAAPIEGRRMIAPRIFGGEGAVDPFSYANKLMRSGAAGLTAPLRGQNIIQQAQAEYNRPQSNIDTAADIATGIGTSILAPRVASAPIEAATAGLSKIGGATNTAGKFVGKKILSSAFGPSEEALSMRYNKPESLLKSKHYQELGKEISEDLNQINKQIGQQTNEVWKTLTTLKSESRDKVIGILKREKADIQIKGGGPLGYENQRASKAIENFMNGIPKQKGVSAKLKHFLDQEQLKQIIQAADTESNWANPEPTATELSFRSFRHKLDTYLKDTNPEYAEKMAPISKRIELVDNLSKSFGLRKAVGKGGRLEPTDVTAGKFPLFLEEKREPTRKYLDQLKNIIGKDYLKEATSTKLSAQFEGGRPAGSRRTLAFGGAGAAIDMILPGSQGSAPIIGMLMGALSDTYGGNIAGKIVDGLRKSNPSKLMALKTPEHVMALVESIKKSSPGGIQTRNLDETTATEFFKQANGDIDEARRLAKEAGYTWEGMR